MAQSPVPGPSRPNWLWLALIVVVAILALVVIVSPSGDRTGAVEDPVTTPQLGEEQTPPRGSGTAPAPEPFAPGGEPSD